MPSASKKQHNLMEMVAHDPKKAKQLGIPQSVGKEFSAADKGRKFGTGGQATITRGGKGEINRQATRYGSIYGNEKNVPNVNLNKYIGKKEGGLMKHDDTVEDKKLIKKAFKMHDKQEHKGSKGTDLTKLKKGGLMAAKGAMPKTMKGDVEAGSNKKIGFGQAAVQKRGLTKGKQLGISGPSAGIQTGGMARGGGVESKGKTKGRMVTMCGGGKVKK